MVWVFLTVIAYASATTSCPSGEVYAGDLTCCVSDTCQGSITCAAPMVLFIDTPCPDTGCTVASCCFLPTCQELGGGYEYSCKQENLTLTLSNLGPCPVGGCTDAFCCEYVGCNGISCPAGQVSNAVNYSGLAAYGAVSWTVCANPSACTTAECCTAPTCMNPFKHSCSNEAQSMSFASALSTTLTDAGCGCSYNCLSLSANVACFAAGLGTYFSDLGGIACGGSYLTFSPARASYVCSSSSGCVNPYTTTCVTPGFQTTAATTSSIAHTSSAVGTFRGLYVVFTITGATAALLA